MAIIGVDASTERMARSERTAAHHPRVVPIAAGDERVSSTIAPFGDVGRHLVVLADMRQLTSEGEPAWEEVHFSLKQIPIDIGGPRRYALLTKPELQPLARMIATVAPEHLQFEAFTDESAATAWLLRHAV